MVTTRRSVLIDSSVYITALRKGVTFFSSVQNVPAGTLLWLSAVVLEELYAGTSEEDRWFVKDLERHFSRLNRVLVPNLSDWIWTGRILAELGAKYGYEEIGRGRLTNDTLIAVSAARQGIVVLTANESDFARIAEFRSFQWEVVKLVAGV